MRIVRSPLRVSLFGGGTDLPAYYEKHGGLVISFALDRCISLIHNDRPTGGCRLSYGRVEEVSDWKLVEHDLVKAYAKYGHITLPATITIIGDVPKGTGLGSSSALSLALAMMYYREVYYIKSRPPLWEVARRFEAYCNPHVGVQDFLPAYYGGVGRYEISNSGKVIAQRIEAGSGVHDLLEGYGVLLYTGVDRQSSPLLQSWSEKEMVIKEIHAIAKNVDITTLDAESLGYYLNRTWALKCAVPGVVNDELHIQHVKAANYGALGGKLCGAGGGGAWFFLVEPDNRQAFVRQMGLKEIPFRIREEPVSMGTIR